MVRSNEIALEDQGLASDTVNSSHVESLSDGVLWLRPGVGRIVPFPIFQELFRDYDIVCRALRDCTLEHETSSGKQVTLFKSGDVIAATTAGHEDLLYQKLEQRGINEDAVTLEPGARWHRGKPEPRGRQ